MDLSKFRTEDLEALQAGDLSRVSTEALEMLQGKPSKSPAYKQGRQASGAMQGLFSGLQGPSFGFADEVIGALAAPGKALVTGTPLADNYREMRDYVRGASDAQAQENPIFTTATRLAASAPTMMLGRVANVAAPQGIGATTLRAGATGAGTGALAGLGESDADTLGGQALDTLLGGALGGLLGSGANVAQRGMGSVRERGASMVSQSAAARFAEQKVAEALARDARGRVAQNNPLAFLGQASAKLGQLGPEGRVVDAAGDNSRALLDLLTVLPGETKPAVSRAINTRQASRADRMIGAAERSIGTNGDRAADVVAELVQTRATAATPLYGRLHRMEVQADPELAELLGAAEKLGAGKVAQDIATAQRVPYSLSADQWNANAGGLAMRDLDHMKQGLDQLIQKQTRLDGSVTPLGFRLQGLQRDLLAKLDDTTGGFYKQARDAFAGPSALISASDRGRRFLSQDDAATRAALAGLSESEKEAFRLGAFEALRNKLGRPGGQTEVMGMWKDKILREKLQTIFPSERAFRQFAAASAAEGRMKTMEAVGRGSQTAQRQFAAGDLDVPAVADAMQILSGGGGAPGIIAGLGRAWNRVETPEPVRDAMGRMLLSQGAGGMNTLQSLEAAARATARSRANQASGLGVAAGQVGASPLLQLLGL
jgi:hypothetical protein